MDACVVRYPLKELRKAIGKIQAEIAQSLGVSQSRVAQINNGDIEAKELEPRHAYATALGGHLYITVSVGPTPSRPPDSRGLTAAVTATAGTSASRGRTPAAGQARTPLHR
ncbi:helix-turn-helix domain-containing protein [Spirillospora sp. NPDC049652]